MKCPRCQKVNPDHFSFCNECGQQLEKKFVVVSQREARSRTYPYVYVNEDGTIRELNQTERTFLETPFLPGDGGRPAVKSSYSSKNGWGSIEGFCKRSGIPTKILHQSLLMEKASDQGTNIFHNAIVRTPGKSLVKGITSANLSLPDHETALLQHREYIAALERCGLEVEVLPPDETYPDSTFVEDVALIAGDSALITRPGAPTRRGETLAIHPVLKRHFHAVDEVSDPGTVEGGDIMRVGSHFYIGLSGRTNPEGAQQVISWLEKSSYSASIVQLEEMLHLKTGLSYLENNNLVASGEMLVKDLFQDFNILAVNPAESYAANCIWVNGMVLVPKGFPQTSDMIQNAGYPIIEVNVSEFQKLDGGLSCLSLRY